MKVSVSENQHRRLKRLISDFLEPTRGKGSILVGLNQPSRTGGNLGDGYAHLWDLCERVGEEIKVSFSPSWKSIVTGEVEGVWGRKLSEVLGNVATIESDWFLLYLKSNDEISSQWNDSGFELVSRLDLGGNFSEADSFPYLGGIPLVWRLFRVTDKGKRLGKERLRSPVLTRSKLMRPSRLGPVESEGFARILSEEYGEREDSNRVRFGSELNNPPVFIVGAPRTGSTLFYQALVSSTDFGYCNNFMAYFPKTPVLAAMLSKKWFGGEERPADFMSIKGDTPGMRGPAEFGELWYNWMPCCKDYLEGGELDEESIRDMRRAISAMTRVFGKTLLLKNMNCGQRLAVIRRAFPEALFLVMRRDPLFIAQSLLLTRESSARGRNAYWSVKPDNYDEIAALDAPEQIAEQIASIEARIEFDISRFYPGKSLEIHYEEFLADPQGVVTQAVDFAKKEGASVEVSKNRLGELRFDNRNRVKIAKDDWDTLAKAVSTAVTGKGRRLFSPRVRSFVDVGLLERCIGSKSKRRGEGRRTFNTLEGFYFHQARQALTWYLRWLADEQGRPLKVGIPAFTCEEVFQAVINAGLKPVVYDLSIDSLFTKIGDLPLDDVDVVLSTTIFGVANPQRKELALACRERGISIVDDLAQWFSIHEGGESYEDCMEAFFYSFGFDKPVSSYQGGFLYVRDRQTRKQLETQYVQLPCESDDESKRDLFRLRDLDTLWRDADYEPSREIRLMNEWKDESEETVVRRMGEAKVAYLQEISKASLPIETRMKSYHLASEWFQRVYPECTVIEPSPDWSSFPTRMGVFAPIGFRDRVIARLYREGMVCGADNWPRLCFEPFEGHDYKRDQFPVASSVADRILNVPLWNLKSWEEIGG